MTISDWAGRLGADPHKSKGPDDFWTICPCHADTKPSLHVYIGKTGQIVMKCFVCGATGRQVCQTLGLELDEVMCDARSGEPVREKAERSSRKTSQSGGRTAKTCRRLKVGAVWQGDYTVTRTYAYQDREGREVLLKSRAEQYDENGNRIDKTFVTQSVTTDGKWTWGSGIYKDLLYHLPDVLKAAQEGGRILIAEGEKDVDNLRAIGYNATCGMNGAGIDNGGDSLAGKWNDSHSDAFNGAEEVVILADNDAAGEGIAQWICRALKDRVKRLKLVRIVEHEPELEEHGDFTDWADILKGRGITRKSDVIARLDRMIDETPIWEKGNIRKFDRPKKTHIEQDEESEQGDEYPSYYGSHIYCIKGGCLACRMGNQGARQLCSFLPVPKETITRDDGSTLRTDFIISATRPDGKPLPDARITGEAEFMSMKWPMREWQYWGNLKVVKNGPQMVADAIMVAGQQVSRHRDVYEHTGMRQIGDKMVYLYNGGAIGAENVSVELEGQLQHYHMEKQEIDRMEAAACELMLLDGMPGHVIYPEMAQAYLAPLYSVMEKMQQPPSYVVYVVGASNAGKSTVTGYVQAHFGSFYNRQFPANFNDTANQVRDKLFWAKDSLVVIDDYRKNNDGGNTRSTMDMVADAAISAVADRADRGRLTADKQMSAPHPCRATCIMTGEDLPRVSPSRMMRLYRIDVEPGEIYKDVRELEAYRLVARNGAYRACMRYYIEDLLSRWDTIEDELGRRMDEAQDRMAKIITRKEGRFLECATHLMTGIGLMLDHLVTCGAMDEQEKERRMEEAAQQIASNVEEQGAEVDASKPEAIWMQTLRSLLMTRSVTLLEKSDVMTTGFRAGVIGVDDGDIILLNPAACDEYIGERLRKSGQTLGASRHAILKSLARAGMIRYAAKKDGTGIGSTTIVTRFGNKQDRMIHMYRWALDGRKPPKPEELGFSPTDGEQMPIEFLKQ